MFDLDAYKTNLKTRIVESMRIVLTGDDKDEDFFTVTGWMSETLSELSAELMPKGDALGLDSILAFINSRPEILDFEGASMISPRHGLAEAMRRLVNKEVEVEVEGEIMQLFLDIGGQASPADVPTKGMRP